MNLVKNWDPVLAKFRSKLSLWKPKTLSFGGRLTLIKTVLGSIPIYYFSLFQAPCNVINTLESIRRKFLWQGSSDGKKISWVAWRKALPPKDKGGLGIGSLKAANISLLVKWWWRYSSDDSTFWKKVICGINYKGESPFNIFNTSTASGIWSKILQVKVEFFKLNIPIHSLFGPRLGDGARISFWNDPWVGDSSLADLFPRLYALDVYRSGSVREKWSSSGWAWNWRRALRYDTELEEFVNLTEYIRGMGPSDLNDCWLFKPGRNGIFSVKALRELVEEKSLCITEELCPWINWIPIKLNVFAWRLFLLRLPTRSNINKRGISLNSSLCELCYAEEETEHHLFGSCPYAKQVWKGISSWCKVNIDCSGILLDFLSLPERYHMQKTNSKLCLAIIICGLWFIWKSRNEKVFKQQLTPVGRVLDDIQASAFMWIKNRWKSSGLNWTAWCCDPLSHPDPP